MIVGLGVVWTPLAGMRQARAASIVETVLTAAAVIAAYALLQLAYFAMVDGEVVKAAVFASLDPEQQAAASEIMDVEMLKWLSVVMGVVSIVLGWLALGAYLLIVAKVKIEGARFGEAIRIAVFASIPNILLLPLGLASIWIAGATGIGPSELNPTSLNQLVMKLEPSHSVYGLLETLSLTGAWSVALVCAGVRSWCASSWLSAVMIGATPALLAIVIWIAAIVATS